MANSDISGQITDVSGSAIGNAEVYLWREDLVDSGGVVDKVIADSSGNFAFTAHPDGSGSSESWHVAAKDPNASVQLQSAYDVTASPPTSVDSQFNVSITGASPSTVAPGETLTVDASLTNSGTDSDTQTITLDVNNGVGQVDSSLEAAQGGASKTVPLSWAVPSGQTEQDYQATVASADDSASETVTVSEPNIDDFESYITGSLPLEYTAVNNGGPSEVVSTRAFSGSQSLKAAGQTSAGLSPRVERTFGPITPSELQMVYQEDSENKGISVQWYGSNGDELCSVGSANPTPSVYNGSGTQLGVNPSPSYGEWRRITVTLDFANETFDVLWEDLTGSTADATANGFSFNGSPTDVARLTIGGDKRGPKMGPNDSNPAYIDDLGPFP